MAKNTNLIKAKEEKNDEFYTPYKPISNECGHYRTQFREQCVYCNCDDPSTSEFWKFFHNNFTSLGLKKLIATHYQKDTEPSYALIYEGGDDFNMDAGKIVEIKGNYADVNGSQTFYTAGDFRSEACIDFLKEATLVCTNPPFSLFREYINQLFQYDKKFLIIGNKNAAHNKDIFPLFKDNKLWFGYSQPVDFLTPSGEITKQVNGLCRWYTNLDVTYRHDGLWHKSGRFDQTQAHCYYEGNEEKYPHYYNFDGIDVDSVNRIPIDFTGYMGVPITLLDCFNPNEFEIIGTGSDVPKKYSHSVIESKKTIGFVDNDNNIVWSTPYTIAERKLGNSLRIITKDGNPGSAPYSRIIVRNLHPIPKKDDRGY